jgi:hypothetical protein
MRFIVSALIVISMISINLESAADSIIGSHSHGSDSAHFPSLGETPESQQQDLESGTDHCKKCCQGHSTGISTTVVSLKMHVLEANPNHCQSIFVKNYAHAPPTPPPNA